MRHRSPIELIREFQVSAAEEVIGFDRGRTSERTSNDAHLSAWTIFSRAGQSGVSPIDDCKQVIGVVRHDFEVIPRRELRQIEFVPVFTLGRF
jgi:hypothetical protein